MIGIHTALVTPFLPDGALDLPAFERLLKRQIDGGVHGVVVCGTTGEMPTVDPAEWSTLVSTAVALCRSHPGPRGRVAVSAGVGTNDTRSTVRNARAAAELGVDSVMAVLPYYNKPNAAGLRAHVREVAAVPVPVMLYHVPGRTAQRLEPALLAELANTAGVVAVKEATGDLRYGTDLMGLTDRAVLSGDDFSFLGLLAQGGTGCVSVLSNVAPAETVRVYELSVAGRPVEAAAELRKLWELATFLFSDASPAPTKAALAALGLCGPEVRLPIAPYGGPSPRELVHRALGGR
ncbi:MAG: 4-hydroxy-tetrahydrodipicolinate synthase [Myxococcota bacterium]